MRNASFRNDLWELQTVAIFDLFKNEGSSLNRVDLTPYFLIGAALFHHNPKALAPNEMVLRTDGPVSIPEGGTWVALQPLGTEGQHAELDQNDANFGIKPYSLWQFAIPIGIGVRYKLANALDLSVDFTFKWLFRRDVFSNDMSMENGLKVNHTIQSNRKNFSYQGQLQFEGVLGFHDVIFEFEN